MMHDHAMINSPHLDHTKSSQLIFNFNDTPDHLEQPPSISTNSSSDGNWYLNCVDHQNDISNHMLSDSFEDSNLEPLEDLDPDHLEQALQLGIADQPADGIYPCILCDRNFDSKDNLHNHLETHNQSRASFTCSTCNKAFPSQVALRKHTAVHLAESGDPNCAICGKYFPTQQEVIMHLKVHSTATRVVKRPTERKFKCERCDRSFFTRKDVKRHMVVHTGQRNFVCQYCPQKFGRKDHLVRHTKKTHTNNNNNPAVANNNVVTRPTINNATPLSDPGVSSTTGLLPPELIAPPSPHPQPVNNHQNHIITHSIPTTPTIKTEQMQSFTYGEVSPIQVYDEHQNMPQSPHHLTTLQPPSTTSASHILVQAPSVTAVLSNNCHPNNGILHTGKDPLVSHPNWAPPSAYISPSFSSYFIEDENVIVIERGNRNGGQSSIKNEPSSTSISSNATLTNMSDPTNDFHPSSTSNSYFTLMPISGNLMPNHSNYYVQSSSVVGNLSPLSPTSPQTTTPLTPPLVDGLGSPLPHFSQAFQ